MAGERLQLHSLFSDHAVLQQGQPIRIFGRGAKADDPVQVDLGDCHAETQAQEDGYWEVELPAFTAGGPYDLQVRNADEQCSREDIWVGEVWLCAGQSNMQFSLGASGKEESIGDPPDGQLRFFNITETIALEPLRDVDGAWRRCTGKAARDCSAVGYHFARKVQAQIKIPIGLIVNALGDTEVAAWTPRTVLNQRECYRNIRERIPSEFPETPRPQPYKDIANEGEPLGWAKPEFDTKKWPTMTLPGMWQLQGLECSGAVWFRRELPIPESWAGRELVLELGAVDDYDVTYFNGTEVGRTGEETRESYIKARHYRIPGHLVRAGSGLVAIRIFDYCSLGGVNARGDQMKIYPVEEPGSAILLAGAWEYQVERAYPWLWSQSPLPSLLYNAMVHPLTRFPIRGILWYQGESDRIRATLYKELLYDMVAAWRELWRQDLPFYIVQLANFSPRSSEPGQSLWAEMRETQRLLARDIPKSGLAVTIDVGDADDIHPRDKQTVGHRLARLALADIYGDSTVSSGPSYAGHKIEGNKLRIYFDHATGLRTRGALEGFAIAGADQNFRWGRAEIDGETIIVHHPDIPEPRALRYAWQDNPPSPLENAAGLPASPFRTDDWPLLTQNIRR